MIISVWPSECDITIADVWTTATTGTTNTPNILVLQLCSKYNYAIWNGVNPKLRSKGVTLFQISAKLNNHSNPSLHSIQQAVHWTIYQMSRLVLKSLGSILIFFIIGLNHIVIYVETKKYWCNWWALTKPQLIIGQSNMIIGELNPLSFHTFLLFKYPIRVKLTQNILREILDISLD